MEQELKEKIKNSGNNLHLDVAYFLKNKGWDTNLSLYYCDDITKTPREIDIKATKTFKMVYDDDDKYKFDAHLFIECKNFSKEFAFRLLDNNFETSKLVLISQNHNIFSSGDNLRNTDLPNKYHYFL